jgi:hypothetical protein
LYERFEFERRIEVDQIHGFIADLRQHLKVVAVKRRPRPRLKPGRAR